MSRLILVLVSVALGGFALGLAIGLVAGIRIEAGTTDAWRTRAAKWETIARERLAWNAAYLPVDAETRGVNAPGPHNKTHNV